MGVVAKLMCQFVWATGRKIHNQTFMDISVRLLFLGAIDVPQWVKVLAAEFVCVCGTNTYNLCFISLGFLYLP